MAKEHKCIQCGIKRKGLSNIVYILNDDTAIYESFCLDCGRKFFRDEKFVDTGFSSITELKRVSRLWDIKVNNEIFSDPEKMKKIRESEPYKNLLGGLDSKK